MFPEFLLGVGKWTPRPLIGFCELDLTCVVNFGVESENKLH